MSPIQATATHHGFPAVLLAIALGGVLGGCDALASDATVGSESPADGGAFGGDRADGGVGVSSPEVDNADGLAFGSCLDAQDNNQDGLTDCEDESCNMAGVCCIDNARCCTVTDSSMVDFGTLTDFGQPSPTVHDGTFFPGGDGTFDSGATLGTTYDLRAEQVLLEATIKPADCADSTCLEVLGIAIVPGPITGNETLVNPTVGLLYRGAYNTVALLLGGTIVNEWTLPNKTTGSRWTLELSPTGQVEVGNGDGSAGYTTTFAPLGGARVALYGRNEDGSAMGAGAGLQALTVTRKTCDTPFQWQSRGELDLVDGNSPAELGSLRGPSVAVGGQGEVRVAFEHEGAILLGTKAGDTITLTHGETNPAITAEGVEYRALGVSDPELLWDPHRNQWLLFFTATSEAGNRSIGRATIDEEGVVSVRSQPVLDPKTYGLTHLAAPSVVWAPLDTLLMVARTDLDGTTRLRVFNSNADPNGNAGIDWREEFASPELEARTTRTPENPSTGFAADEIGSAGLVIQNRAYHLYVEGRRGARWSIGILASDDLEHWREPREGEAVLGKGNGFDSLGLRSPDAIFLDGQVTLLYEGLSNGGSSLGFAQRVATAATAP